MHLQKTTQYAIRILNYLAIEENGKLHSAKELSISLDISYKFLTKIITNLVKAGLIVSVRGRDGGIKLSKDPTQISIDEVLEIFNDVIADKQCILGIGLCDSSNKCGLHDQWEGPKTLIKKMFKTTTLDQLHEDAKKI